MELTFKRVFEGAQEFDLASLPFNRSQFHAGLPTSDVGKYYTEEQMETRIFALRHAFKMARQFAREQVLR